MKKLLLLCLPLAGCNIPPTATFTQDQVQAITQACVTNNGYVTQAYTSNNGVVSFACVANKAQPR